MRRDQSRIGPGAYHEHVSGVDGDIAASPKRKIVRTDLGAAAHRQRAGGVDRDRSAIRQLQRGRKIETVVPMETGLRREPGELVTFRVQRHISSIYGKRAARPLEFIDGGYGRSASHLHGVGLD